MKRKKSRFWSFCFSFLPGAAEMYMGFMKTGLSLMGIFFGITAIAVMLNIGEIMFLTVIAWFYAFFHANNLAGLSQAELECVEDKFLFHVEGLSQAGSNLTGSYRKIVALVLVVLGGVLCIKGCFGIIGRFLPEVIRDIYYTILSYLPQVIVGVGIVAMGMTMIKGKKKELLEEFEDGRDENY